MDILSTLKAERAKLDRVITMLEADLPTIGSPVSRPTTAKKKTKRRPWTEAEKKAMSIQQKALWAAKKKKKA